MSYKDAIEKKLNELECDISELENLVSSISSLASSLSSEYPRRRNIDKLAQELSTYIIDRLKESIVPIVEDGIANVLEKR